MKKPMPWLLVTLCLAAGPAPADDVDDAAKVVRDAVDKVLGHVRNRDMPAEAKREAIVKAIEPLFDFPLMGKLTLGERHWNELTPDEKKEFTELFTRRLKDSYLDKIALFTDGEVKFEPPVKVENKVHVTTRVTSKADQVKVVYKLYPKRDEGWKGYDFEIEGVSMISSYRAQYTQVLKAGTVKDLLAKMAEQTAAPAAKP
jgi:phospholipid transport system substrate-binding protein